MHSTTKETQMNSIEFDFVKGHIAATMTLIHALIDQGAVDRERLDGFFKGFIDDLPNNRDTLSLRLIIDQWREGLRNGESEETLKGEIFAVIEGGRIN
ncbi:hypothetical protein [Labrenzia sp. PHM005]|uniref:hypothetical protein n=1 Tax=Stappiaceae TaxID=2821832 RepID=UPI001AD90DA8|nr:hypothetical protein [Labrenzia sp. PHM005]